MFCVVFSGGVNIGSKLWREKFRRDKKEQKAVTPSVVN
jgi:hypothetical protein